MRTRRRGLEHEVHLCVYGGGWCTRGMRPRSASASSNDAREQNTCDSRGMCGRAWVTVNACPAAYSCSLLPLWCPRPGQR